MVVNNDIASFYFYITYLISFYPLLPQPSTHPFSFSPPFSLSLSHHSDSDDSGDVDVNEFISCMKRLGKTGTFLYIRTYEHYHLHWL